MTTALKLIGAFAYQYLKWNTFEVVVSFLKLYDFINETKSIQEFIPTWDLYTQLQETEYVSEY